MAAKLTAAALETFKAIAQEGTVNMYDRPRVCELASKAGMHNAAIELAALSPQAWCELVNGNVKVVGLPTDAHEQTDSEA